jgi:succinoglycan biosynthesis transport protein ExoP
MEVTQYLAIARRWWWLLVLTSVAGGVTAYVVSKAVTPTYRATTTLLVVQQQESGAVGLADLQASERLANTFTQLVTVRPVLESAIARGGLSLTPDELDERLSVSSPPTTQLLEITAEASNPEAARDLANLVGETFIDSNQSALGSRPGSVSIVERAEAPLEPSAPRASLNALIGALLAFAATAAIVAAVEYMDDTVKNDEAVGQLTGLPVVGYVSQFARPGKPAEQLRSGVDPHSREAEAYRSMRTNITYSMGTEGESKKRLLVTSPGPGEGKSTTAANLAVVFGLAGSRVALVDADLRRPTQHRIFGIPNTSGLTNLLANSGVGLEQAVHRTAYERVWLVPSGPIPANPSELLGSGRMNALLTALEEHFDIVILDAPPALAVTDPAVLSSVVTASVVVVQQGKTRSNELKSAVQRLAVAGKPIAGVVINRVAGTQRGYYYAEYRTRQTVAAEAAEGRARIERPVPAAPEPRRATVERAPQLVPTRPTEPAGPAQETAESRNTAGG